MYCRRYRKFFSAYLDGDLDTAKHRRFEEHLRKCESCAGEFAEFRKVVALTADLPQIQPSPYFDASLRTKLVDSEFALGSRIFSRRRAAIAIGAVCILLAAFISIHIYNNVRDADRQSGDEQPQLFVGREVIPSLPGYADERAVTNFVMPSVPVIGVRDSIMGDLTAAALEDGQEGRTFILPVITNPQERQDRPEQNYVIRKVSLISSSDETGL